MFRIDTMELNSLLDFSDKLIKCGEILFKNVDEIRVYSLVCTECFDVFNNFDDFVTHVTEEHNNLGTDDIDSQDTLNSIEFIEKMEDEEQPYESVEIVEEALQIEQINFSDYDDDNADDSDEDFNASNSELNCNENEEKNPDPLADQNALKLATIIEYEKHPVLWNSNLSSRKSRPMREKALLAIATSVNKLLKLKLSIDEVTNTIQMITNSYKKEVQKQRVAELNGEKRNQPWYYAKLKFLEKREIGKKNENEKLARRPLGLPLPCFDDEQHSELFAIFKEFPSLWDVYNVGYHTKQMREKAVNDMLEVVNEKMDLDFTAERLRKRLYEIRYACSREKYQKVECERMQTPFKPECKYWAEIEFLEPHVQPFKCPYCEKVFGFVRQYILHCSEHDGSLPYKCSICNQGFKVPQNCVVHMRRHTQDYPHACKLCDKSFASTTGLTHHLRRHNGDRPFVCEICGQSFYKQTQLSYHNRRHTNDRSFICSICSKAFYDQTLLNRHMKRHQNLRDKVCNICGKAFNGTNNLRQHMQIHDKEKKYWCPICGKSFSQNAGLRGHIKTHDKTASPPVDMD